MSRPAIDRCPKCGGSIVGDGITMVEHCEYADTELVWETEPDAPVILCDFDMPEDQIHNPHVS